MGSRTSHQRWPFPKLGWVLHTSLACAIVFAGEGVGRAEVGSPVPASGEKEPDSDGDASPDAPEDCGSDDPKTGSERSSADPSSKPKSRRAWWRNNFVYRYLKRIFGMPEHPERPRFIAYPVVAYAPETSWEFGLSGLVVYYAKNDPTNRLSEVGAYGFVTLQGQFGVHADHAIYSHRDRWFILGEAHFQSFPLKYYGIGSDTEAEPRATVDEVSLLIRERVLRKIVDSLYIGPEFSFDLVRGVQFNWREDANPVLPPGADGSVNFGMGVGIVYDNRHNVLNVRDGLFSELAFLHYDDAWGSDFQFTVLESDTRYFVPINERDTLAAQLFCRFTFGDVPFNELSTLGGESLLRGYYLGRYRDRHFVGAQVEYRFLPLPFFTNPFWRRFGASVFVATGTVFSGPKFPPMSDFVVAGGAGLRFLLFPDKDVYTRADLAFTEEGPAFYLFVGEAF